MAGTTHGTHRTSRGRKERSTPADRKATRAAKKKAGSQADQTHRVRQREQRRRELKSKAEWQAAHDAETTGLAVPAGAASDEDEKPKKKAAKKKVTKKAAK